MDRLIVQGGKPLFGSVPVSGAKNAALPILAASPLFDGPVCLERVPRLGDVQTMTALLESLGASISADDSGLVSIENDPAGPVRAPYRLVRRMRAGVCVLGPLVARRGRGEAPLPGGCRLGDRPIDLHLKGLESLSADVRIAGGLIVAKARRLRGAKIDLLGPRGPTVTGTANLLCAAVLSRGTSLLCGAAREPEIVELGAFLITAGAQIAGLGTSQIEVQGVRELRPVRWQLMPDRIEAATLLLAGCITRGAIAVEGANAAHLSGVLRVLESVGVSVRVGAQSVSIDARGPLRGVDVCATPYPGVPTDVQPQLTALLSIAAGRSVVRDDVFPERFAHVAELRRLGADIRRIENAAQIEGPARLTGAPVTAHDLRGAAALVLAALAARGRSVIHGCRHLDRGYEALDAKLNSLGAQIERPQATAPAARAAPRGRLKLAAMPGSG